MCIFLDYSILHLISVVKCIWCLDGVKVILEPAYWFLRLMVATQIILASNIQLVLFPLLFG